MKTVAIASVASADSSLAITHRVPKCNPLYFTNFFTRSTMVKKTR